MYIYIYIYRERERERERERVFVQWHGEKATRIRARSLKSLQRFAEISVSCSCSPNSEASVLPVLLPSHTPYLT